MVTYAVRPFGVIAMYPAVFPTLMAVPGLLVAVLIGVTVPLLLAAYRVFPSGVMARSPAPAILIGAPGLSVAVLIGVTVPLPLLTYAVLPPGVMTMKAGWRPTLMGGPALLVPVLIGVTVSEPELVT